jgi:hypothetical protein
VIFNGFLTFLGGALNFVGTFCPNLLHHLSISHSGGHRGVEQLLHDTCPGAVPSPDADLIFSDDYKRFETVLTEVCLEGVDPTPLSVRQGIITVVADEPTRQGDLKFDPRAAIFAVFH